MPKEKKLRPAQHQKRQPGREYKMQPQPKSGASGYVGCGKLRDKIALIDTPLGRAGEPEEVATSYVFLASDDSSYMTGQVLHPNGGRVVNG